MNRLLSTNLFTLCFVILYFVASVVLSLVTPKLFAGQNPNAWFGPLLYLLSFGIPALLYALLLKKRHAQRLRDTLSLHPVSGKSLLLTIGAAFTVQPLMMVISFLSQLVFKNTTTASMMELSQMPLWLFLLSSAVFPAIFEELICRGIIQNGYRETPLWYSLLMPALFFGMLHLNFQQVCYAIAGGVFFALLYHATHSVFASMVAHFIINGSQSLIAWFAFHSSLYANAAESSIALPTDYASIMLMLLPYLLIMILTLPLLVLCMHGLFKVNTVPSPRRIPDHIWHKGSWPMYVILGFLFLYTLATEFMLRYMAL